MLENFSGSEKVAVLLAALGDEETSKILNEFSNDDIKNIKLQISKAKTVKADTKKEIMSEFLHLCLAQKYISKGDIDYAKNVLEKIFDEAKAKEILVELNNSFQVKPFSFLLSADLEKVLMLIQNEHSQAIALVLSYLPPKQASIIVSKLPEDKQVDVVMRIAATESVSNDVIIEVEKNLEKEFLNSVPNELFSVGGINSVIEILKEVDYSMAINILENLKNLDEALYKKVKNKIFLFEDILKLNDLVVQKVLEQNKQVIGDKEIAIALMGSSAEVQAFIFKNLTERRGAGIRYIMESFGSNCTVDAKEAKRKIADVIKRLSDEEKLVSSVVGSDDVV